MQYSPHRPDISTPESGTDSDSDSDSDIDSDTRYAPKNPQYTLPTTEEHEPVPPPPPIYQT